MKLRYVLTTILIFIVVFKLFGKDVDYYTYVSILKNYNLAFINIEPLFGLFKLAYTKYKDITLIILLFYLFYCSISISLKVFIISKYSNFVLFSFILYFSNYYFLHDYVQVRVSVSASIFLLSLLYIDKTNKYIILNFLSLFFHYISVVSFFIFLFLKYFKNIKYYYLLFFTSIFINLFKFKIFTFFVSLPLFNLKLNKFQGFIDTDSIYNSINIYNLNIIFHILFLFLFSLFYHFNLDKSNKIDTLYKVYIISICFYLVFYWMPVISFRIYEYLAIVEILLIPELYKIFKQKQFFYILIFLFISLRFINLFFINKLINI